ncbi:MAG: aminotransferase class I/II-fold pyridoxal phosphate-dependent enzyme [Clostridia bacterium]|nr:aminotransferase class I/II-fold pyridoxal phosphate-dependent enzyme [Clostridia bacterium]
MPGHKGKISFYDITEIDGADNLACPKQEILTAQNNIADIYKSKNSFISVNGSTGAVLASILSTCKNGEIIMDRQCHISAINGVILSRAVPHFIYPKIHSFFGVGMGITPNQVQEAINKYPNSKAVLITSPTYYGVCSNIKGICEIAHNHGIPVIVDAAHGAHFAFDEKLPECSIEAGADIVVHSTHKTLNCLTQGALAHISGNIIDCNSFKKHLNMVQTTSPSYLLMQSVEQSVYDAKKCDYKKLIDICEEVREKSKIKTLCDGFYDYDKTRLVFNGKNIDLHFAKKNIIIEMYDGYNAVLIPTPYNKNRDFKRLINAVADCTLEPSPNNKVLPNADVFMAPYEAYNMETVRLPKKEATGKICAEIIYKFPPCMPVLCPGEIVTEDVLDYIDEYILCIKN